MTAPKRQKALAADQKMLDGCNKRLLALATVTVGGQPLKPADVVAKVQSRVAALEAVDVAEAAFHDTVQNNKQVREQTDPFVVDLRATIRVLFGKDIVALADFGMAPPRPRVRKPQTLVDAAARAKATRALRGTVGSKKRKAIKAPATPAETPAPAAAPPAQPRP